MTKKHKFELPEEGLTTKQKVKLINKAAKHYAKYMDVLLPGWKEDVNSADTPLRVAKAFVEDIGSGLYNPFPKMTAFDNIYDYPGAVLQSSISVKSLCSHHHQNIYGTAHVAYIPGNEKIIGLSKLNRIVEHYSRRPQVQENLAKQIHEAVNEICVGNKGVAVIIKAKHMCVGHRGVNQEDSWMITPILTGGFMDDEKVRSEFYKLIDLATR